MAGDPATRVSEEDVVSVLRERRNKLGGVVVSGGEPTLQLALPRFLRRVKALGLDIKLDTNGSHPGVVRQLLKDRLLDYVAMDVKAPWSRYAALTGTCCDVDAVQASMALIASSGVPHQFRTTRVDPLLTEHEYGHIRTQIPQGSPHAWQAFRPAASRDPALSVFAPRLAIKPVFPAKR
jgi:pyruvate formate lyase activating enzyme